MIQIFNFIEMSRQNEHAKFLIKNDSNKTFFKSNRADSFVFVNYIPAPAHFVKFLGDLTLMQCRILKASGKSKRANIL